MVRRYDLNLQLRTGDRAVGMSLVRQNTAEQVKFVIQTGLYNIQHKDNTGTQRRFSKTDSSVRVKNMVTDSLLWIVCFGAWPKSSSTFVASLA